MVILALVLLPLLVVGRYGFSESEALAISYDQLAVSQGNSVLPFIYTQSPPKGHSYASVSDIYYIFYGLDNKETLMCLAQYESGFQTDVYGDSGKAYGILQYWESTFDMFCKGDYENPRHQAVCADNMLSSGLGFHWTTFRFCTL